MVIRFDVRDYLRLFGIVIARVALYLGNSLLGSQACVNVIAYGFMSACWQIVAAAHERYASENRDGRQNGLFPIHYFTPAFGDRLAQLRPPSMSRAAIDPIVDS